MQMTLQCAYCGNEDHKMDLKTPPEELEKLTITCKCGRFLVRDGIMGHVDNIRQGDKVKHVKGKFEGVVVLSGKKFAEVFKNKPAQNKTFAKSELIVTG